ncbi:hypothetical protein Hamer_G010627 [Homarus americanus]|uniref:Uncharacterized protein n=1 Tax=Homarus americanus TaxID=6706 RepID=A0A8J5JER2_HOMAM|nr:hypothetical protein Hamer_G010627 [Homarus americanus]
MVLWWLVAVCSTSTNRHLAPGCVAAPRLRVPGGWMPVRGNSRRLGGSLYRWVVLRLIRRRLHPEAHAHLKNKHAHCSQKSIRLRGPEHIHGTGSPKHEENGKSSITSEEENEKIKKDKENVGVRGGITKQSTRSKQDTMEVFTINSALGDANPLSEIQTVDTTLKPERYSLHRGGNVCVTKSRIQLVREAPEGCKYPSHISRSEQEVCVAAGDVKCPNTGGGHRRDPLSPAHGAVGGRTSTHPAASAKSLSLVSTPTKICKNSPNRTNKGPFPLLNVQGLDQGSVQSLTVPKVCKHINTVRQWDSISVLYGVEYLTVRKKVHERLLCILRERRERRLRREARESILTGGRPRKHPHRRKRKKRKGKIKHDSRKDRKENKLQDEVEDRNVKLDKRKEQEVVSVHVLNYAVRTPESNTRECREEGELVRGEPLRIKIGDEGKNGVQQERREEEEEEKEKGNSRDNSELCDRSPSLGSGDSRPSRSPSYHKVTSSEKSSSATSYLRSRETPTRDISPRETPRSSAITIPSATSSSASSSSSTSSPSGSSPSAKSTGGPSTSNKTSPTVAYISDDESASERRRSTLYCCPCFVTFRKKTKKSRRSCELESDTNDRDISSDPDTCLTYVAGRYAAPTSPGGLISHYLYQLVIGIIMDDDETGITRRNVATIADTPVVACHHAQLRQIRLADDVLVLALATSATLMPTATLAEGVGVVVKEASVAWRGVTDNHCLTFVFRAPIGTAWTGAPCSGQCGVSHRQPHTTFVVLDAARPDEAHQDNPCFSRRPQVKLDSYRSRVLDGGVGGDDGALPGSCPHLVAGYRLVRRPRDPPPSHLAPGAVLHVPAHTPPPLQPATRYSGFLGAVPTV